MPDKDQPKPGQALTQRSGKSFGRISEFAQRIAKPLASGVKLDQAIKDKLLEVSKFRELFKDKEIRKQVIAGLLEQKVVGERDGMRVESSRFQQEEVEEIIKSLSKESDSRFNELIERGGRGGTLSRNEATELIAKLEDLSQNLTRIPEDITFSGQTSSIIQQLSSSISDMDTSLEARQEALKETRNFIGKIAAERSKELGGVSELEAQFNDFNKLTQNSMLQDVDNTMMVVEELKKLEQVADKNGDTFQTSFKDLTDQLGVLTTSSEEIKDQIIRENQQQGLAARAKQKAGEFIGSQSTLRNIGEGIFGSTFGELDDLIDITGKASDALQKLRDRREAKKEKNETKQHKELIKEIKSLRGDGEKRPGRFGRLGAAGARTAKRGVSFFASPIGLALVGTVLAIGALIGFAKSQVEGFDVVKEVKGTGAKIADAFKGIIPGLKSEKQETEEKQAKLTRKRLAETEAKLTPEERKAVKRIGLEPVFAGRSETTTREQEIQSRLIGIRRIAQEQGLPPISISEDILSKSFIEMKKELTKILNELKTGTFKAQKDMKTLIDTVNSQQPVFPPGD